jgi:hypothetical protein
LEPWETGTRHLGGECAFSQPGVVTVRRPFGNRSLAQWIFDVFESLLRAAGQAKILKSRATGLSSKVFDFDRPAGHNVSPRELYSHLQ